MSRDAIRLLIHHHHQAYLDDKGNLYLSANIGRWVNAIADYVDEVGLLLYSSSKRTDLQDTLVTKTNVKLWSLGSRKTLWQRKFRYSYVKLISREASKHYNVLLIRGITPHQTIIWKSVSIKNKAYLVVGSIAAIKSATWSLRQAVSLLLDRYRLKQLKTIAQRSAFMLANSPAVVEEIGHLFGVTGQFAPTNTLQRSEVADFEIRPVGNPVKLLYCGRLDLNKGINELLLALSLLNKNTPSYHLEIVAPINNPIYEQLTNTIIDLGLTNVVHWQGHIPFGPKLLRRYQSADALVLPTYFEGFPKVYWEAAANCCPVITTAVGGIPSLLTDKQHAILIPPRDIPALVFAVKTLFSDFSLRETIITNSYLLAEQFTVEACARILVRELAIKFFAEEGE